MKQGGRQWAVCDDYGTASDINGVQTLVEKALGLKFEARTGLNRGDYYLYCFQYKTDREAIFIQSNIDAEYGYTSRYIQLIAIRGDRQKVKTCIAGLSPA